MEKKNYIIEKYGGFIVCNGSCESEQVYGSENLALIASDEDEAAWNNFDIDGAGAEENSPVTWTT